MTETHKKYVPWYLQPYRAIWKLVVGIVAGTERLVAAILGLVFRIVGVGLTFTVIGAIVGSLLVRRLGTNPNSVMAASTRARVSWLQVPELLIHRETVMGAAPARFATSLTMRLPAQPPSQHALVLKITICTSKEELVYTRKRGKKDEKSPYHRHHRSRWFLSGRAAAVKRV